MTVDENGEVTDCDLDRIAAVDEETAEEYTQTAQQKNKTTGFQGIYRYRVTETEDGAKYVFLLVVIFSRMVFRPVEESIQKQKRFQDTTDDHRCKHRGHGNGKRRIPVSRQRTKMAED